MDLYIPFTSYVNPIHRISGTIGVGADSVVLLGQRILAEPGRGPGIIDPGAEVQVGTAGSCCRGARRNANLLACNFLATEAVPERGLRRTRAGGPYPALASKRIIVKPLQDRSLAILNHPHTAQVVRNLIVLDIAPGVGREGQ